MANNLDKQYLDLLQDILTNGTKKGDRTGTGTISVFGRQIRHKMSEGFPVLTTKKIHFKGVVTELLWFLKGDTNIKYLVDNNCLIWVGDAHKNYCKYTSANSSEWNEWMRKNEDGTFSMYTKEEFIEKIKTDDVFANKFGNLGRVYGAQWRKWSNPFLCETNINKDGTSCGEYSMQYIDQITNLINKLRTNPDDRRMLVTAWNPAEIENVVLPPCHYGFQCYTRELSRRERRSIYYDQWQEKWGNTSVQFDDTDMDNQNIPTRSLSMLWNQRSCDSPLGIPYNTISYSLLLSILSKMTNMVPDELIGNLGDTHIYLNQIEGVQEQLTRTSFDLPKLVMSNSINFSEGIDEFLDSCSIDDFQLENYQSHSAIKIPLSN